MNTEETYILLEHLCWICTLKRKTWGLCNLYSKMLLFWKRVWERKRKGNRENVEWQAELLLRSLNWIYEWTASLAKIKRLEQQKRKQKQKKKVNESNIRMCTYNIFFNHCLIFYAWVLFIPLPTKSTKSD